MRHFESLLEWIASSKRRIKVYRVSMRSFAVVLFCWSLHLAWSMLIFRDFPHVHWRDYGAMLVMMLARGVFDIADLFSGGRWDGNPPDEPAPWPQLPEILDLEYNVDKQASVY